MTLRLLPLGVVACLAVGGCSGGSPSIQKGDAAAVAPGTTVADTDPRVEAADHARIRGDSSAAVWLVMASDFQCPACKFWHDNASAEILRDYVASGKVRFAYINFPLSQHQNSRPAAEAAMCGAAQGRFWEMHDALFARQDDWATLPDPMPLFRQIAGAAGVDVAAWDQCLADDVMLPLIDADRQRGVSGGVDQTPTFFVGSQRVGGAIPATQLRPILDAAIAAASAAPR